jgi:hypothetical protein
MKRTPHHILVGVSVHLPGTKTKPESKPETLKSDTVDAGLTRLSSSGSTHAPSPDWLAAWPNPLDEDALDELAEALRPLPHTAA